MKEFKKLKLIWFSSYKTLKLLPSEKDMDGIYKNNIVDYINNFFDFKYNEIRRVFIIKL